MNNQLTKYTNVSEHINTNISENANRQNTNAGVIYRHNKTTATEKSERFSQIESHILVSRPCE